MTFSYTYTVPSKFTISG